MASAVVGLESAVAKVGATQARARDRMAGEGGEGEGRRSFFVFSELLLPLESFLLTVLNGFLIVATCGELICSKMCFPQQSTCFKRETAQ